MSDKTYSDLNNAHTQSADDGLNPSLWALGYMPLEWGPLPPVGRSLGWLLDHDYVERNMNIGPNFQQVRITEKGLHALALRPPGPTALSVVPRTAQQPDLPGLPVAGYKPTQPPTAIEAVSQFKYHEERILRLIDDLVFRDLDVDARSMAIGKTQLQGAFMFLARAVFQPHRVRLPEDDFQEKPTGDTANAFGLGKAARKAGPEASYEK